MATEATANGMKNIRAFLKNSIEQATLEIGRQEGRKAMATEIEERTDPETHCLDCGYEYGNADRSYRDTAEKHNKTCLERQSRMNADRAFYAAEAKPTDPPSSTSKKS
jgi:hypothetical protein